MSNIDTDGSAAILAQADASLFVTPPAHPVKQLRYLPVLYCMMCGTVLYRLTVVASQFFTLNQFRRNVAYVAKAIRMTTSSEKFQSKDQRERALPNDLTRSQAQAIAEQFAKKTCDLSCLAGGNDFTASMDFTTMHK